MLKKASVITYHLGTVGDPCNPHTKGDQILRVGDSSHTDLARFLLQVGVGPKRADVKVEA